MSTDIKTGFSVQLSNFSYVISEQKKGHKTKKLRFTLVITANDPDRGELAIGWDGCLAHRTIDNILVWSPPLSRINPFKALKTGFVNETMYDLVVAALSSTEYVAAIGRDNWCEEDRNPRLQNPDLPEVVNV